jgi:ethanolamine transporter EutH
MSKRGQVFGAAFEVGAAYAIGDHLAYIGTVEPEMIVPMIVGKTFAGVVSLVFAYFSADMFVKKGEEALTMLRAEQELNRARKRRDSSSDLEAA